jgi:two-component system, OmpR family, sensor histidine kinase SenX3
MAAPAARASRRTAIAATLLACLLVLVATLQYRWTGELGRAAEERARAGLDRAAAAFASDFDRELARLLVHFHPYPGEGSRAVVAQRLRSWRASEAEPDVLKGLLVASVAGNGEPELERWDEERGGFVASPWPTELRPLAAALAVRSPLGEHRRRLLGAPADAPALVVPLRLDRGGPFSRHHGRDGDPDEVAVLWLDERALREELLPALGERYFAGEVAYRVEVRDATGELLYAQGRDTAGGEPDAVASLFAGGTLDGLPRRAAGRGPLAADERRLLPRSAAGAGRWQLAVTHPAGSLTTAMARARWRQLGLSFAVLALLGGAAGMLLVAARRAEALARRQVELVAGVSHELLTPVAALRSAGENLAAGVVSDPEQVRRYGELVEREGRRLGSLVEQVLTWAGLQARAGAPVQQAVDPAALVTAVAATCAAEAAGAGVALEVRVAPGLPPLVGDPDALERALRNLVENALRHGGSGGWVAVGAEASPGRGGEPGVALFVEDRGPGLAAAEVPRIYEPFYRGGGALAAGVAGSGLGLALVRQIVEAHGGRVRAGTVVPRGARFTLELPAGQGVAAVAARDAGVGDPAVERR